MKQKLIVIFFFISFGVSAQVCFTYDGADNRIKREICVFALSNEENSLLMFNDNLNNDLNVNSNFDDLSTLILYPNPTSGVFRLKNQEAWYGKQLLIIGSNGNVIDSITISESSMDMTYLPSGSYFLTLMNSTTRKTAKLIVTK